MSILLQLLTFPSFLFILTVIIAFVFILLIKWLTKPANTRNHLPPYPPGLPIIGNLHQLGSLPHRSLLSMAKCHGDLMLLHFGRVPVLVASSADTASLFTKTHDIVFANRPTTSIFKRLVYDRKDVATSPYGEYWRHVKSILVSHLLSNKKVKSFNVVREEETTLILDKVKQAASAASPINLSELFATFSMHIVCRTALGKKYEGQNGGRATKVLVAEFSELLGVSDVGSYVPWLKWVNWINGIDNRVDKLAIEIDEFLDSIIEEHAASANHEGNQENGVDEYESKMSMVDILLRIQKENTPGFSLERIGIKALLLDMFAAGTDSSYAVLEWAMTELLRHPDCMQKLQNEVWQMAKGKNYIVEDDLEGMRYLKAVIKETLRLHPPLPILLMRESSQDVNVQGYDIRAGTQVIINAWAIGRDPCSWDKPEEFLPERFSNSVIDFRGQHFEFIPFGAGRRVCPGIQFANAEIELVIANFVYKFDWSLCKGITKDDIDMTEKSGLTAHRRYPLIVVPKIRI